jgi:hypothetical protein
MNSRRIRLNQLGDSVGQGVDLFITSASFESRCRSVADSLAVLQIGRVIVAENEHKARYISDHGDHLRARFGAATVPVALDPADPVATADALWTGLKSALPGHPANVLVDITTFTHESLLILTKLLVLQRAMIRSLTFLYASAAEYSFGSDDDQKWLSRGVSEVRSVLGFAGEMLPSRRQHLIILVGFEHERAAELIKTYEPSVISLGHGRAGTATSDKHEAANRHFHRLVEATAATYGEVRTFDFACNNPVDAQHSIEKQVRSVRGLNAVVAPMNTKLSTLGAVLAAQSDATMQVCYARATQYNYKSYSLPGDDCYVVELPELFAVAARRDASSAIT